MGLDNIVDSKSGNDNDNNGSPSKTQLVFWDQPQAKGYGADAAPDIAEAYKLANGSGTLRNTFDDASIDEDHSWEDLHHFVAEILVGVNTAVFEGSYNDLLDTLMVDGSDITEYMDDNPEVKQEVVKALNEEAQEKREQEQEEEEEKNAAEADD